MTIALSQSAYGRRVPWPLIVPAVLVGLGVLVPLVYLVLRASAADWATLQAVVFRWRNLVLLGNTLGLTAGVLSLVTLLAVPMAWLVMRTDLPFRRGFTLLAVLPLAVPGYLMAYALLALGGYNGPLEQLTGYSAPRLSGFWGATIALSLYNLPYMFLNLRVAFARMDRSLEEAARSLGHRPLGVFFRVVLPQLRPAFGAGALLVSLHVIGDFGVVSLMRYESFSYALYQQYQAGFDRIYAAWLALMLLGLTAVLLVAELRLLRGLRLDPVGAGSGRPARAARLGAWKLPAVGFLGGIALLGVGVPVVTMGYWGLEAGGGGYRLDWAGALLDSVTASLPAAVLATAAAVPVAYLARRYPSWWSRGLEQTAYIGYAVPSLAFALALVFFVSRLMPMIYGTLAVLIYAYTLHFLAEAIGPVRSALYVATPRVEEASRSLGRGRWATLFRVTLPLLRPGLVVSVALVFLSAMKELPLTLLLSPLGFSTLATEVYSYTSEAMFAQAAPFALTIVIFSAFFVGLLLMRGHGERD